MIDCCDHAPKEDGQQFQIANKIYQLIAVRVFFVYNLYMLKKETQLFRLCFFFKSTHVFQYVFDQIVPVKERVTVSVRSWRGKHVIGDFLGHRDPTSTAIYAKVDLRTLREVAALDLEGLV